MPDRRPKETGHIARHQFLDREKRLVVPRGCQEPRYYVIPELMIQICAVIVCFHSKFTRKSPEAGRRPVGRGAARKRGGESVLCQAAPVLVECDAPFPVPPVVHPVHRPVEPFARQAKSSVRVRARPPPREMGSGAMTKQRGTAHRKMSLAPSLLGFSHVCAAFRIRR